MRCVRVIPLALFAAVVLGPVGTAAAPNAKLWPEWAVHDPASTARVDHGPWGRFLDRYLVAGEDGVNRLRYAEVTDADRSALDAYVDEMTALRPTTLRRDEQFAYWVNLYNAVTVQVVLDHYPVERILDIDISPGFFSTGPWGKKLLAIEGEMLSLDDIEHRILRPVWNDPRIHYVVNCASVGCPNLRAHPYDPDDLETALDAAARDYVNSDRGVYFIDGQLGASSIYKWYSDDFGGNDAAIIRHLIKYASPTLRLKLAGRRDIRSYAYDWRLNDASGPQP